MEHLLKHFDRPDEVREFPKGRLEIVTLTGATVGRATYQPGWSRVNAGPLGRPKLRVVQLIVKRA